MLQAIEEPETQSTLPFQYDIKLPNDIRLETSHEDLGPDRMTGLGFLLEPTFLRITLYREFPDNGGTEHLAEIGLIKLKDSIRLRCNERPARPPLRVPTEFIPAQVDMVVIEFRRPSALSHCGDPDQSLVAMYQLMQDRTVIKQFSQTIELNVHPG